MRPLAEQLRATPPARARRGIRVWRWTVRARRRIASSATAWTDAARSISRWVSGDSGRRGGPPKSLSKRREVMVSPWQ